MCEGMDLCISLAFLVMADTSIIVPLSLLSLLSSFPLLLSVFFLCILICCLFSLLFSSFIFLNVSFSSLFFLTLHFFLRGQVDQ